MKINLKNLDTEKRNNETLNIDRLETREILLKINNEDKKVATSIEEEIDNISKATDIIYEKVKNKGRLIYIGAGTSGRLGVLDAAECPPTYGVNENLVIAIIAGGEEAMTKAKEGAEDSKELAIEDLKKINLSKRDVVLGIAASGRTPYVIGGLEYAKSLGADTVSLACVKNSEIGKVAKVKIEVIVGAEAITGSTRMKAGTAQKLVLNMISTTTMIKYGKVYENLMVDLKPTNEKLVERSKNIIMEATGCKREKAERVFLKANKEVKLAIFMILSNLEAEEGRRVLKDNEENIFKGLKALEKGRDMRNED